jgi:hypothetical protein
MWFFNFWKSCYVGNDHNILLIVVEDNFFFYQNMNKPSEVHVVVEAQQFKSTH